jgi:hypothetical protein
MRKDRKKTQKGTRMKKAAVKDLAVKDAKAIKGGKSLKEPGKLEFPN